MLDIKGLRWLFLKRLMFKRIFGLGFVSFAIYTLYFSVFKKVNITLGVLVMCFLIMDVFIYYKYKERLIYRFPFYWVILLFSIFISYLYLRMENVCNELAYSEDVKKLFLLLILAIAGSYIVSIFLYRKDEP